MGYVSSYIFKKKVTAPDATTITAVSQKVPKGKNVKIISGFVADYTTANKKLIIGIRDNQENDHYLTTEMASNDYMTHLRGHVILLEGESMVGIVETPTTSDVCYFAFFGDIYEQKQ